MRSFALFVLLTVPIVGTAQIHVGAGQTYPTLAAAASARVIHPGDTVFVHAGIYSDAKALFDSLIGTPENWITIEPYQQDSVSIHVQYTFQAAQYLRISGLHFYGNDRTDSAAVFHLLFFDYQYVCFTSNHDIIIENCTFDELNNTGKGNTGACLKLDGTANFQVLNCAFRNGTNITDGISLNADSGGEIRGCTFENMPGDGSHCKGGSKNITYEKNRFTQCAIDGLDVGGDTGPQFFCPLDATWEADSIRVYDNIFIGGDVGIRLSSCHHSFLFNNTCFKSSEFAFRSLNTSETGITLDSNYVYNNIFTTDGADGLYMNASDNFNYNTEFFKNNLFHDYLHSDPPSIGWSEMPGVNVSGSLIGDPDFTDTANGNFSLKPGSPAIGAGTPTLEPLTDYRSIPYAASGRTIGAFEFQNAGVDQSAAKAGFILSPNPCSRSLTVSFGNEIPSRLTMIDALGREAMPVFVPPGTASEWTLDVS
ncbi:MAG TPA: right-handed parallel beta-helix repeat-containing protein, partial [Candidatus Kapabacteria bacterium]